MIVNNRKLSSDNWDSFAAKVAAPSSPRQHVRAAMDRYKNFIKDYRVDIKGMRPKFKSFINTQLIKMTTEERVIYDRSWERYCEACARLDKSIPSEAAQFLVEQMLMKVSAEILKARYKAQRCVEILATGKSAAIAVNYKQTAAKIVQELVEKHGIDRRRISMVWGGIATRDQRAKDKKSMEDDALDDDSIAKTIEIIRKASGDIQAQHALELLKNEQRKKEEELYEFEQKIDSLLLGIQTTTKRANNIDRYQLGKADICIYTFKAGGVGLSLHHTDFHNCRDDVRRKCNSKPRYGIIAPTWSAIETVQGVGRLPRITSISDTYQDFIYFEDTIEEDVAAVLGQKLRSLKSLVMQKESWDDMLDPRRRHSGHRDIAQTMLDSDEITQEDEDNILMGEGFDGE